MKLSNVIEDFINEMIREANGGEVELKRNALADKFSCVPSQINYVLSTRFSPERGYLVESRRGGGGYVRIIPVSVGDKSTRIMHAINAIGDSISYSNAYAIIKNCYDGELISKEMARLMLSAISGKALSLKQPAQDEIRAKILKNMLVSIA